MMLDAKSWIYTKLTGSTALVTALGGSDRISTAWPNSFQTLPMLVYMESNQENVVYYDNLAKANREEFTFHIFTAWTARTYTLAKLLDDVMQAQLFTCRMNQEADDPLQKTRHRVLRYERNSLTTRDVV